MLSDDDLAAILARCDAAAPGPWRASTEGRDHLAGSAFVATGPEDARGPDLEISGATAADYDFIAHARQDVARLVSEVRRLRELADSPNAGSGPIVFVDVDDTLVRSAGSKRIPIPSVLQHVRDLHRSGARLYCWSSGGADYARRTAVDLGVDTCFRAFLPKPHAIIDDQTPAEWRNMLCVHPNTAVSMTLEDYARTTTTGKAG